MNPGECLPASDLERRTAAFGGFDYGAHGAKRISHPSHRALGKAVIAGQFRIKRLGGQQTREKTHGRAGIAQVERPAWCLQTVNPNAVNAHVAVVRPFDGHAHVPERLKRCKTVFAFQKALYLSDAVCQRTQHDGAVRDRFVARHPDITGDWPTGLHPERYLLLSLFCHVSLS